MFWNYRPPSCSSPERSRSSLSFRFPARTAESGSGCRRMAGCGERHPVRSIVQGRFICEKSLLRTIFPFFSNLMHPSERRFPSHHPGFPVLPGLFSLDIVSRLNDFREFSASGRLLCFRFRKDKEHSPEQPCNYTANVDTGRVRKALGQSLLPLFR